MRSIKRYIGEEPKSSFLSCEKDAETIIRKLFVESAPYSDELKRLLLINTKDCLDDRENPVYIKKIQETSVADLVDQGYIRFSPTLMFKENENVKSYIIISFDEFSRVDEGTYFRDCIIEIDVICNMNQWDLGNFRQRPLKIMGYIDGLLNESKLTGIGTINFLSAKEIVLSEELAGYCLMYKAYHGNDDKIEEE